MARFGRLTRAPHFMGQDRRHSAMACPHCDYSMDTSTGLNHDEVPGPGSIAFCVNCGQWSAFSAPYPNPQLRKLTDEELMDIHQRSKYPEVNDIEEAWLSMRREMEERKAKGNANTDR